ncbi:RNA-directed DNA polymerase, eukaryota, reverse transcriptase zinc-binding domain protein [Tanacetum coccineum]
MQCLILETTKLLALRDLHLIFSKKAWGFVGNDVYKAIKEFFINGKLLGEVNATVISLVPKIPTPNKVIDYRLISCCNVMYKCISKVLTNRIKDSLNKLVNKNQSAFIPGRLIQDNIMLIQELLIGYNRKSEGKSVAFKINIQKAYDTVNWNFLEEALKQFRFHQIMCRWIMTCITTPSFIINVNGEKCGFLKGSRGLRQGDPISPYLFTLIMKIFTLMLERKIKQNPEFKYHKGCKDFKITHLCFAADLVVLCHEDKKFVEVKKDPLEEFSSSLGLLPNPSESNVFFGNVGNDKKEEILSILPFSVQGKLTSVKVKIAWSEVCKPKDDGGLDIKDLSLCNKAMLVKHLWNLVCKKDTMWVKWIHAVNIKGTSIWNVQGCSTDSWGWKNLLNKRDQNFHRAIYKIVDMIKNNKRKLPNEWLRKYPKIVSILVPTLNSTDDKVVWKNKKGKIVKFYVRNILDDLCDPGEQEDVIHALCKMKNNNSIWSIVRRITLGSTVYFISNVRNTRLFKREKRGIEAVGEILRETIRLKLMSLIVKNSAAVLQVEQTWDI